MSKPNPIPSALAGSVPDLARQRCGPLLPAAHVVEALAGTQVAIVGPDASLATDRHALRRKLLHETAPTRPGAAGRVALARTGPQRPAR